MKAAAGRMGDEGQDAQGQGAQGPGAQGQDARGQDAERQNARRRIIGLAARATTAELEAALSRIGRPEFADVRRPEIGLVMLRGRMGGDGAAFNLGEATVSRAAVRLQTGEVGHSYSLGRNPARARLAALIDALWQRGEHERIEAEFARPVAARLAAERQARAAETAATRVDFFTLVRGED